MIIAIFIVLMLVGVSCFFVMMGGGIGMIWQPSELFMLLFFAMGAFAFGNPKHVLVELYRQARQMLASRREKELAQQFLMLMHALLETAADGIKALDEHVENVYTSELFRRYPLVLKEERLLQFVIDNFRLMAMGKISSHELDMVLEQEIYSLSEEMQGPARAIHRIAEAMPGFGIMVAVLGFIIALGGVGTGKAVNVITQDVGIGRILVLWLL